jgi:succinyl-diaminopimelate desuccinylase
MNDPLLPTLKRLIAIPSVSSDRAALQAAVDLIASYIKQAAPDATIEHFKSKGKPSLLAYAGKKRPPKFAVLLNGHVDVVPAKPEQFKPRIEGNKLFGRGAQDMKSAALVLTTVFCELAPRCAFPLGLQIVADEEVGGHNGTAYQLQQGVVADFVVCGEFTPEATICNESRGVCQVRVHFAGKVAHSAYLWEGNNALLQAHHFIDALLTRYPVPKQGDWVTTANISSISTPNAAMNQVPGKATLDIDIRYIPDDPNFAYKRTAKAFLRSLNATADVEFLMFEPSHFADPGHPLSKKLAAALQTTTDKPTRFIQKHGGADVRFYSTKGIPAMVMGVQGAGLHGDNEYCLITSITQYKQTLARFLDSVKP